MWTRQYKRRNTGRLIVPSLTVLFLAYFGYHAFQGEYGIYAKYRLEARVAELNTALERKRAVRGELERRVQLMHDGTIERDMLDEQARRALNVSSPDEVTIMKSFLPQN